MVEKEVKLDNYVALKSFTKSELLFEIGDRKFKMKPLVPKKLRELIDLLEKEGKSFSELKGGFKDIVYFGIDKIIDVFKLIFDEDIDKDFVDSYISVPLCYEIWENFVKLNRLEKFIPFFQQAIRVINNGKPKGIEQIEQKPAN